ncbi:hypothetical protein ACRALDRAFT_2037768 [Sodiomyces alcalophilus JCM 7366]|uniref:uncharacterized protein n=1 Tax=Sodiomyces alcalophilus JCM 7366 TaxID=591952 RepID=UPI0039B60001
MKSRFKSDRFALCFSLLVCHGHYRVATHRRALSAEVRTPTFGLGAWGHRVWLRLLIGACTLHCNIVNLVKGHGTRSPVWGKAEGRASRGFRDVIAVPGTAKWTMTDQAANATPTTTVGISAFFLFPSRMALIQRHT